MAAIEIARNATGMPRRDIGAAVAVPGEGEATPAVSCRRRACGPAGIEELARKAVEVIDGGGAQRRFLGRSSLMSVAKILVLVRGDGKGENVLSHAAAIARKHNAHIEVVHCRARPADLIPYGVVVPPALREQIKAQAEVLANAEEVSLQEKLLALLERLDIAFCEGGTPPRDRPTASWREEQGKQTDVMHRHGRLADLIVVAKPDRDRNLGTNTLKVALFDTGRPVMICPPTKAVADRIGNRVAIAWNGSTEAARAVALALALIQEAEEVVVFDGCKENRGAGGPELIRYLALRDIAARRHPISGETNPGRAILEAAGKAGADLLLMGAYSRSRGQETVFGGATQHVVDKTTIPVVMVR